MKKFVKKTVSLAVMLAVFVSVLGQSVSVFADNANLEFAIKDQYSGVQGQDGWHYKYRRVENKTGGSLADYGYNFTNARWYFNAGTNASNGFISGPADNSAKSYMAAGLASATVHYNPVLLFDSPYNGRASISADLFKGVSQYTCLKIKILKNNEKIWPSGDEYFNYTGIIDNKDLFNGLTVDLAYGDELIFEVETYYEQGETQPAPEGTTLPAKKVESANQRLQWQPRIVFENGAVSPVQDEIVFADSFENGELDTSVWTNFNQHCDPYQISGNTLMLNAKDRKILEGEDENSTAAAVSGVIIGMPEATDYTVEFDMNITENNASKTPNGLEFVFRKQNKGNYNVFFDNARSDTKTLVWRKNYGSGIARIDTGISDWGGTDRYSIKVSIKGQTATVSVNGKPYTQDYSSVNYANGGIEFRAYNCNAEISNFKISGKKEGFKTGDVVTYKGITDGGDTTVAALCYAHSPFDFTKKDVKAFLAVYDENQNLIGVSASDPISFSAVNSGSYLSCQVINNGITDNSKVKVFVWEDGKIVPLKGATETTKGAVTGDISDYNDLVVNKGASNP